MAVHYLTGDATQPVGEGNRIVAHVCNDIGAWGAGFVMAVSKRWPQARAEYLKATPPLKLGTLALIPVEKDIHVANMVAQRGIRASAGVPPIRYEALRECLVALAARARELRATVHMPRIGCGLAGGRWDKVEPLIAGAMPDIQVFVYDPGSPLLKRAMLVI